MRSLFLKIFLSYWMAQALFLILAILATLALSERGEYAAWDAQQAAVLNKAVQIYEQGGPAAVRRYLDEIRESLHARSYLLDEQGQGVSGRDLPPWAESLGKGIRPPRRDLWQWVTPSPFRQQSLEASSGHRYTLVAFLPPRGPFLGPGGIPGLSILIGIISSGLVCYLLARYLTSPVVRLRAATQRLAAGDLTARAGGLTARRRDEMAQLVRDFDTMAERLEESVHAQARLLHDISHELRSPLARLNVASALARQRAGQEARSALDRIDLEAERLNDLIGGLLAIARLESGNDSREKSAIPLAEMIEEIAADADFEAQGVNCRVECVIKQDCTVRGAPILLHSAIENVVRNAAHYSAEGTTAQVLLERGEDNGNAQAVIRIVDSGPGVPEDALDKLFRPFYRIDDARGRQTGGVGLGLAITERAIRLHGGTVKASNRGEGGLQIEIRLPLAPAGPSHDLSAVGEPHPDPAETTSIRS
ncbi:MAG TPA: ATP-binding protein [Terriglobales bacterium]|jgi:two-component system sensor histidine kinase CpxA|nr:ATP-binding protein [Terriglobales bacterium]